MMIQGMRRILVPSLVAAGLVLLLADPADAQRLRRRDRGERVYVTANTTTTTSGETVISSRRMGRRVPVATPYYSGYYTDASGNMYVMPRRTLMRNRQETVNAPRTGFMSRRGYMSFYPPETIPGPDQPVALRVRVPVANAEIWFGESKTTQTGTLREFLSPPIAPNQVFTYEVRARWTANGQPVERTRTVQVRAGQRVMVDMR